MTEFSTREEMVSAVEQATAAAKAYYSSEHAPMTDAEYDGLLDRIEESVHLFNDVPGARELFTEVAAGQAVDADIPHSTPMLSLKKVKEPEDINAFENKVKALGSKVLVELKLDGSALAAHYQDGKLVQAVTRGNGVAGKDVTSRMGNVIGLPDTLPVPLTGEVRGEVYMTTSQFESTSQARVDSAKAAYDARTQRNQKGFDSAQFAFSNSRNAVSGLVNRDEAPGYSYEMSFAAYDVIFEETVEGYEGVVSDSYSDRVQSAADLGITAAVSLIDLDSTTLLEKVAEVGAKRDTLDIPTDGCVIKADSSKAREAMGVGARHPHHSVAYKYESLTGETVVEDIEVAVGRTGRISLRARVQPVLVETLISYVSLHNPSWLEEKDVRIGSKVTIERANDVIPQVVDVLSQPENSVPYKAPEVCPQCGQPWNKDSLLWRCESPECGVLGSLIYAASRDALDIEDFGDSMITAAVDNGLLEDLSDVFSLTVSQLAALPTGRQNNAGNDILFGSTRAKKVIAEIEQAKGKPFALVITALGLRATGRGISRRLAERYKTMDALLAADVTSLAQTEAVASKKAAIIHSELRRMESVIKKMAALGVNMAVEEEAEEGTQGKVLEGKSVCVTDSMKGSALDGLSRNEVNELITDHGGRASSSVSKTTSILVCETGSASSKMKKAQSLGTVEILTPDEFAKMVMVN